MRAYPDSSNRLIPLLTKVMELGILVDIGG